MSTQTRSSTIGIGMSPAIPLQSDATRAHLPRPPTVYKAPHSRTTTVSRANWDSGSFRRYSRIPLHLRGNALGRTETNTPTDVRNSTNSDHSGKAKAGNTVEQTRVGCKILTPARFVQLVQAVVAQNDIYGRTSCSYRNI